jgi:hypothetical protein
MNAEKSHALRLNNVSSDAALFYAVRFDEYHITTPSDVV